MGISQFPGVGPTNTDVANAVVTAGTSAGFAATGPTTTQIAAAVPNLTQITSAITSNAASAGVTLAAIGTAVANNSSPFGGSWVNIAVTSPGNVNGIAFTGLSGYRYYRLFVMIENLSGSCNMQLRLNSDSSTSYSYTNAGGGSGNVLRNGNEFNISGGGIVAARGYIVDFPSANSTSVDKMIFTVQGSLQSHHASAGGVWANTSAINRIDVFLSGSQSANWYARLIGTN